MVLDGFLPVYFKFQRRRNDRCPDAVAKLLDLEPTSVEDAERCSERLRSPEDARIREKWRNLPARVEI